MFHKWYHSSQNFWHFGPDDWDSNMEQYETYNHKIAPSPSLLIYNAWAIFTRLISQ